MVASDGPISGSPSSFFTRAKAASFRCACSVVANCLNTSRMIIGFSLINYLIMDLISDLSASEKSANAVGADEIKQKIRMIWAVSSEMKRGIKYIILNAN